MASRAQLRKILTAMHEEADPCYGDYDSYGKNILSQYQDLLGMLGLGEAFEVAGSEDENGYFEHLIVRPRTRSAMVPDIADWGTEDVDKPSNIDECIDFWMRFAKEKKLPK